MPFDPDTTVATLTVAADGSGEYTDIQSALDALHSAGGAVYIKDGTYTITSAITIPSSNIAMIGAGKATKITTSSDIVMISADTLSGLLIKNLFISGAGVSNQLNRGIYFDTVTNSKIENCWVENCGSQGITLDANSDNNDITGNQCSDISSTGIAISDNSLYNNIIGNHCYSNVFGISTSGSSYYTNITGNQCYSNGADGIALSSVFYCNVGENICYDNSNDGIHINTNSESNTVTGNELIANHQHGIFISDSSHRNIIVGNVSSSNDVNNTATYDGINLTSDCDENIISNNRCESNDRYEINIDSSDCDNNLIIGNNCIGTDHEDTIVDNGTSTVMGFNIIDTTGNIYHKGRFVRIT